MGIGTCFPNYKLEVAGTIYSSSGGFRFPDGTTQTTAAVDDGDWLVNGTDLYNLTATGIGIGTDAPNYKLDVRGSIGNNATLYHSDRRWKKEIRPLGNSLGMVTKLRGVSFEWRREEFAEMNFPEGKRVGLIAQEVEEVIPELVNTDRDGYKSVEYANLVALLIEAVKEQQATITELQDRLEHLEKSSAVSASESDEPSVEGNSAQ